MAKGYVIVYLKTCHEARENWLFAGDASISTKAPFDLAKVFRSIEVAEPVLNGLQRAVYPEFVGIMSAEFFSSNG